MKKNKNVKKIILSIIVLILLVILGIFGYTKFSSSDNVENTNFWDYDNTNRLKVCKKKEVDCHRAIYDVYDLIKLDYDYKPLNKELDKVNKETMRLYKEAKESDMSDVTCDGVRNLYNYRISNTLHFDNYENDSVVSIAVHRMQMDLCTGEDRSLSYEAFVYDKETKKLLTQQEIRELEDITDEEIANAIKTATDQYAEDEKKNYELQTNYNDVIIYYGIDNEILIAFKVPGEETYLSSILDDM